MAEGTVRGMLTSSVLDLVVQKIDAVIEGRITLQLDFTKDLKNMKRMLETLGAVLEDAERQSIQEKATQLWLKRLKDAMYGISDMLDEFEEDTQQAEPKEPPQKKSRWTSWTSWTGFGPNSELANRMKEMREELKEITDQHKSFMLKSGTSANVLKFVDTRETAARMGDHNHTVGRTKEKKKILASLTKSMSGRTTILPIYGFGGIGKTTLAQMVYNDAQFKDYSRVWVYVSETFDLNKIGNSIISQLSRKESKLTERQMINTSLVELLAGKNILVVLDDLWQDNGSQLDDLKHLLMAGADCKIVVIVTTRSEGIANMLQTIPPFKLAPLSNDSCWTIIKQKSGFDTRVDKQQLEQIGKDIAVKCGGVALAARSLGHMLKHLTSDQWESVRKSNIWNVSASKDTDLVLSSLRLSYSYMPSYLKLCFAYCAIFPKGHKMVKDDLIHQWNSMGFIEGNIFSTEQLGENYIRQLLGLSFLEHSRSHNSASGVHHEEVTHLTMHDLVHDLARLVLADELMVGCSTVGSSCRYALLDDCSKSLESFTDSPAKIRALRFLNCGTIELHGHAFSSAKYLRVLDFSECFIQRLPDSIGQFKQLRYLNAPGIQHESIPNCITNLSRLVYLSLCGSSALLALPDSIGEMGCLMYLDLSGCSGLGKLPESFHKLIKLVHLDLSNCSHVTGVSESLPSLSNLEYLNLSYCSNIQELPQHLGSLLELKYLNMSGCGKLEEFPRSFGDLKKLVHLDLSHCDLVRGIEETMGRLTKLQYLNLSHCSCIDTTKMAEAMGNLIELKYLNLSHFLSISTSYTILECIGTLSNLEHLDLSRNEGIWVIPDWFCSLKRLRTLDLSNCSDLCRVPPSITEIDSLKMIDVNGCHFLMDKFLLHENNRSLITLPNFEVHADDCASSSNLVMLTGINPPELNIQGLDKVKSVEEAQRINLVSKSRIKKLKFHWRGRSWERVLEDKEVLEGLMPPSTIESLQIECYSSESFPDWLMGIPPYNFPNLTSISLVDLENCSSLPPLGQLPNLKLLVLNGMQSIVKIDEGFCGGAVAFPLLETFILKNMQSLEVWNTTQSCGGDGSSSYMFPNLCELVISSCPKLRLEPCPPKAYEYLIEKSDCVISSWGESAPHGVASTSSCPPVTNLDIRGCEVPMHQWMLLRHLPGLQHLEIWTCSDLTSSPEIIQALSSLQSLSVVGGNQTQLPELLCHLTSLEELKLDSFEVDALQDAAKHLTSLQALVLSDCENMTELPHWVGDLVSLQRLEILSCKNLNDLQEIMGCRTTLKELEIWWCDGIESLPDGIQQLTKLEKLEIYWCPALERCCESEDNKMKLAHIKDQKIRW